MKKCHGDNEMVGERVEVVGWKMEGVERELWLIRSGYREDAVSAGQLRYRGFENNNSIVSGTP